MRDLVQCGVDQCRAGAGRGGQARDKVQVAAHQAKLHAASAHSRALAHSTSTEVKADWAFGAGVQATTYVSRLDENTYLEHGLSWYAKTRSLALTPGHRNAAGDDRPGVPGAHKAIDVAGRHQLPAAEDRSVRLAAHRLGRLLFHLDGLRRVDHFDSPGGQ